MKKRSGGVLFLIETDQVWRKPDGSCWHVVMQDDSNPPGTIEVIRSHPIGGPGTDYVWKKFPREPEDEPKWTFNDFADAVLVVKASRAKFKKGDAVVYRKDTEDEAEGVVTGVQILVTVGDPLDFNMVSAEPEDLVLVE